MSTVQTVTAPFQAVNLYFPTPPDNISRAKMVTTVKTLKAMHTLS